MNTKVEQESTIEPPHVQTTITAKASAASASSPKISMFARKSGFVIPKNKLSGSLVPIFKGGNKPGGGDAANDESSKQVQRKTKWGPDLTQDTSVRKGRALAYQIRLDQITKQLNSELLETEDNQDSPLAAQVQNHESSARQAKGEKPGQLELERRETIGEILKLNPSFKAPPDYKPLLKETKVPVPVKEYPGYNFIGLIFGSTGDTQKQLEKKTGAKIRAYGTKMDTGEKVEISPSDSNATHGTYKEVYIHIVADSYEKIDAAVAPIELLITTVSVNPPAVVTTTSTSASVDNANGVGQSQSASTSSTISAQQEAAAQSILGSAQTPHGNYQPYPGPWFQSAQPRPPMGPPTGFIPLSNLSPPVFGSPGQAHSGPFNASSLFGPRPGLPQNPSFVPPRPQPILQRPFMPQSPFGQIGAPRNPHGGPNPPSVSPRPPLLGNQTMLTGGSQSMRPLGPSLSQPERPLTPSGTAAQWSLSPSPGGMVRMAPPPMGALGPHPPSSSSSFFPNHVQAPRPFQSSTPISPMQQATPASNAFMRPIPVASPSSVPGSGPPSFTPLNPSSLSAPRPHSSSNNFTFQPQRPQNMSSSPGAPLFGDQPSTQNFRPQISTGPQSQSFQPSSSDPVIHGFSRPHFSNQMNPMRSEMPPFIDNRNTNPAPLRHPSFASPSPVGGPGPFAPQMGPRNPNPAPHMGHVRGPFPPMSGHFQAPDQRPGGNILPASSRPPYNPGELQTYDPFSPTSASNAALQRGSSSKTKQESDPEYEDLMASVGVK